MGRGRHTQACTAVNDKFEESAKIPDDGSRGAVNNGEGSWGSGDGYRYWKSLKYHTLTPLTALSLILWSPGGVWRPRTCLLQGSGTPGLVRKNLWSNASLISVPVQRDNAAAVLGYIGVRGCADWCWGV